jgi:hypothetical protein
LSARSARWSGWRAALDEVGAADHDPGLRAAEQLVAREADEVGAGGERVARRSARRRSGASSARAEVVDERQPWRRRLARARQRGCSVKPTTRKFDWCTRRSSAVSGRSRARSRRRACGSSSRPRRGARPSGEHVRDAEAVADLDQLAARDEHLAALGERGEREQDGRGVVVDDERRLGAGQRGGGSRRRGPGATRAPCARSYSRFE